MAKEFFSPQCPYLNGNSDYQCHSARSLPVARTAIGYDGLSLVEVKKDLCQSPNGNRGEICPAFKDIEILGHRSEFARLVSNNR